MREFAVVYECGDTNWGAIVPDLPGCVSIGDTFEDVQRNVKEAIELSLEVLQDLHEPIPELRHTTGSVLIAV